MLKFLIVTCLLAGLLTASPSTISGPLYMADGTTLANGTVTISWGNFSASDGHYVPAGQKIVVVAAGAFSQALEPSTNSSPAFSYKIAYRFGSQPPALCSWTVGTSNASIPAVETCPSAATSVPATNIALSQISIGGGANGQCMIISSGVWSAQNCTQSWTINVNDLYNSNTGNVGIGGTPGNYKLDVSKSGSTGTLRVYDQTAVTGSTLFKMTPGAGQSTNPVILLNDSTDTTSLFKIGYTGAINTHVAVDFSAIPGNHYLAMDLHSGGGGGANDHSLISFSSGNTSKWKIAGVWNGVTDFRIQDPEATEAVRFQITKSDGSVTIPELGGGGSLSVCVDNAGRLYAKATCP